MTIRLAVLSDIHGNLPALEAVLDDIGSKSVDGWILAGDYTAGPNAVECIQVQRSLNGWCITGNGEIALRRFDCEKTPLSWRTLHQFAVLRWDHSRLDRDTLITWLVCPNNCASRSMERLRSGSSMALHPALSRACTQTRNQASWTKHWRKLMKQY